MSTKNPVITVRRHSHLIISFPFQEVLKVCGPRSCWNPFVGIISTAAISYANRSRRMRYKPRSDIVCAHQCTDIAPLACTTYRPSYLHT